MPLMFNTLLIEAGLPPAAVRLVRHKDPKADKERTPYDLWCNHRKQFEQYQKCQSLDNHEVLNAPYWAVFVGTHSGETRFVGLYSVKCLGPSKKAQKVPTREGDEDPAGSVDEYRLTLLPKLSEFIGKLVIDWGKGRTFVQHADRQNKPVIELRPDAKEAEQSEPDNSRLDGLTTKGKTRNPKRVRKPGEPRDDGHPLMTVTLFKDGHRVYPPIDRTPHFSEPAEETDDEANGEQQRVSAAADGDAAKENPRGRKRGKRKPERS